MVANYATVGYTTTLSGAQITFLPGVTRDSVTDAAAIATWSANWTTTAPTATTVGASLMGWLGTYPRGTVS